MKTHKLMIKTHNITNLKYLCYTRSEGELYNNYKGSGVLWKKHLKKHGDDISTELIFETDNFDDFKQLAIEKSKEFNIVDSSSWANLKIEEGDGGDTVSNKMWITDGINDKYHNKDLLIPEGWNRGRSKCVFNDSKKQKEFSAKADRSNQSYKLKKAWNDGKFDKRPKVSSMTGKKHTQETKDKISKSTLKDSKNRSERAKIVEFWKHTKQWKASNNV